MTSIQTWQHPAETPPASLVTFHLAQQGITYDPQVHWVDIAAPKTNKMCVEYRRKQQTYPLMTLVHAPSPAHMVLTEMEMNAYKFKEFAETTVFDIYTVLPGTVLVLTRNGDAATPPVYLGIVDGADQATCIHVWERDGTEHGKDALSNTDTASDPVEGILNTLPTTAVTHRMNDHALVADLLYSTDKASNRDQLRECGALSSAPHRCTLTIAMTTSMNYTALLNKYRQSTVDDVLAIHGDNEVTESNRFFRNKIIERVLPKEIYYWMLNEAFKNKNWRKSPYPEYDQYLRAESMPAVFSFLLFLSNFWLMDVRKKYDIEEEVRINIDDMFIAKYTDNMKPVGIDAYEPSTNKTSLVLTVQLNSRQDFRGGDVVFEDASVVALHEGDMLIHYGKKKRSNGAVESGEKLVLVMFLTLQL